MRCSGKLTNSLIKHYPVKVISVCKSNISLIASFVATVKIALVNGRDEVEDHMNDLSKLAYTIWNGNIGSFRYGNTERYFMLTVWY